MPHKSHSFSYNNNNNKRWILLLHWLCGGTDIDICHIINNICKVHTVTTATLWLNLRCVKKAAKHKLLDLQRNPTSKPSNKEVHNVKRHNLFIKAVALCR